jgi:hypothetical protein
MVAARLLVASVVLRPTRGDIMSDNWIEDMLARGYSKGPAFQSYDEMSAWDKTNTRPHVRSAVGGGYQVCFTDGGQTADVPSRSDTPKAADAPPISTRPPLGAPLDEVNVEFPDVPF